MTEYELMIILDAVKTQEQKEAVIGQVAEVLEKSGGKVKDSQVWLEKHKFPFKIKRVVEGTYYLIRCEGTSTLVDKAKQLLKLNDAVVRHLFVKV